VARKGSCLIRKEKKGGEKKRCLNCCVRGPLERKGRGGLNENFPPPWEKRKEGEVRRRCGPERDLRANFTTRREEKRASKRSIPICYGVHRGRKRSSNGLG